MRKNNSRGARVNSDVRRVLSHIIEFDIKDPRISSLTSVVKCEVTNDLKECKCYISVLGSDEDAQNTIEGLRSASGFVRKRLAESLNLRYTPVVEFKLDRSIEYGVMMSKKIDDIVGKHEEDIEDLEDIEDSVDTEGM